ncbi:MAG: 5-(carboxyamino)imidazole ribonucleotide mutase [Synergistaceae bacterium]|nr:5-(carboxyamino)imidazole ribonucleotide mutase [Synergistaceae bacterium]
MKKIAIIMGSDSDLPIADKAAEVLKKLNIPFTLRVMSAHRTPDAVGQFARGAAGSGFGVVIAIAGKAAHLAGFIAAQTRLPVIGVPVKSPDLGGLDALLSTVQMPSGVPVATVAIDGGANAAWLAARMLALSDEALSVRLEEEAKKMAEGVEAKDRALREKREKETEETR